MQDQNDNAAGDAARRVLLLGLSLAGVVTAAVLAPRLGMTQGLGVLGIVALVLVVVLLAISPDDEVGDGAQDIAP